MADPLMEQSGRCREQAVMGLGHQAAGSPQTSETGTPSRGLVHPG